jgi:hypothetical protein
LLGGAFAHRHSWLDLALAIGPGQVRSDIKLVIVQCGKIVQFSCDRTNVAHASHAILFGKIINLIVIIPDRDALVRPLVRCNMNWFDS